MAHSNRPSTPPEKVLAAAGRDTTLFTKRTWAREAAATLEEANATRIIREKGKDAPRPNFASPPPWRHPLPSISHDWLQQPKNNYLPQVLRAECLSHLMPLSEAHEITIYTDGSVDTVTGAAGAAIACGGETRQWRVTDWASSLQTELVAIRGALEYVSETRPRSVLIATDSKASLQALNKPQPADNVGLITHIFHLAQQLQETNVKVTLYWVPGHTAIRGNELADQAARVASSHQIPDVQVPRSLSQVKSLLRQSVRACSLRRHVAEVASGSRSAAWYQMTTRLRPLVVPASMPSRIRSDLHRLRLGYLCASNILGEEHSCDHCEAATDAPLLHYLLQCPETASIRNANYDTEDETAASTAAGLVANTPLPTLARLVQRVPPPR